jgi:hypothetical protein
MYLFVQLRGPADEGEEDRHIAAAACRIAIAAPAG